MKLPHVTTSPFWDGGFHTTENRPLSLHDLGVALGRPQVSSLTRRLLSNIGQRVYWYRWRASGLDFVRADTLAINAGFHPMDVWGMAWG